MARKAQVSESVLTEAKRCMASATSVQECRAALSILLPALLGISLALTATILGRSRATVVRLRRSFVAAFTQSDQPARSWGGRRRSYLTLQEEREFLAEFLKPAQEGGILVVNEVKKAFEAKVGDRVSKTTIYRMLARHGWRKVAPRRKHPGADPEEQEAFKKTH